MVAGKKREGSPLWEETDEFERKRSPIIIVELEGGALLERGWEGKGIGRMGGVLTGVVPR